MDRRAVTPPDRPVQLIVFGLLVFGISWGIWIPMAFASHGLIEIQLSHTLLTLIGSFGPSLAAVLVTAATDNWTGVRQLLARLLIWRVGLQWYVFVLLCPAALSLLTTAIHSLAGEA